MRCLACSHNCSCPRVLHTGEGKVAVPLTKTELRALLYGEPMPYGLATRLERALELVETT